jgi:putative hydrolase of the HAD superfamily
MKPLPAAFLFDLDDTILSLSQTATPAWEALCQRFVDRIGQVDAPGLFRSIQQAQERFWQRLEHQRMTDLAKARRSIVADAFRLAGLYDLETAHDMADTFSRERLATIVPFEGAVETLERLRARGLRLALITNGKSKTQREKIEHFSLASLFDCIVVEEEFGVGKPNPRVFRHALGALGVTPAEAWMVGDNLAFDIAGAQPLGIHAIWHDVHGRGLPPESGVRPDRIIRSLTELLDEEGAS